MDTGFDDHPVEPDEPWPKSPTNIPIRCNRCMDVRVFADRHAARPGEHGPGPHCKTCGRRIEFRCTVCGEQWRPAP